nr:conjugal transfer protein TraH [Azospirillum sp. SYSU D00513]
MHRFLRSSLLAGSCALGLVVGMAQPSHAGGLKNEMDSLFNSMSNVTAPGVWETQRRGVFSGGSVSARNRIINENLISVVPPSFEAGCGGIDLFGGSFSFINADQFVQLMRGVAANAAGYAFHLALSTMAPDVAQTIEMMQKKVQELNQYFGNSCQLAQGLVNDVTSSFDLKGKSKASVIGSMEGVGDIFTSWTSSNGKTPNTNATEVAPGKVNEKIRGNLVWRAMKRNGVSGWFAYGDNELLEIAMNITGTVIVGEDKPTKDNAAEMAPEAVPLNTNRVTIRDLMDGGNITIMGCQDGYDEDECKKLGEKNLNDVKGFRHLVLERLIGNSGQVGIIQKLARQAGPLTAADAAFLSPRKDGLASMVIQLSKHGEEVATEFARAAAPHLALELAEVVIDGLATSVAATVGTSDDTYAKDVQTKVSEAKRQIEAEKIRFRTEMGSRTEVIQYYTNLMSVARKARLAIVNSSARN